MFAAIIAFFSGGFMRWLLVGGVSAAVLAGGYWYVGHLRDEVHLQDQKIGKLAEDLAVATKIATENAAEVGKIKAQREADMAAVAKDRDDALARLKSEYDQRLEVKNAPEKDNGPVSPVMRRTLDGLRRGLSGTGSDSAGQGGKTVPAGKLPKVRGRAVSAG